MQILVTVQYTLYHNLSPFRLLRLGFSTLSCVELPGGLVKAQIAGSRLEFLFSV